MKKIKIEVVERAGWWQVKVCGLPFEISLAGGRWAWREAARGAVAKTQRAGAQQGRPHAARTAPARRALRVVLHTDGAARATLTAAASACD